MSNENKANKVTTSNKHNFEFHIEEYKTLRQEIESHSESIKKLEQFSLTTIAAIYTWIASSKEAIPFMYLVVLFVPVIITIYCYYKSKIFIWNIRNIGSYIKKIEIKFSDGGWENYLVKQKESKDKDIEKNKNKLSRLNKIFWTLVFATTLIVFIVETFFYIKAKFI